MRRGRVLWLLFVRGCGSLHFLSAVWEMGDAFFFSHKGGGGVTKFFTRHRGGGRLSCFLSAVRKLVATFLSWGGGHYVLCYIFFIREREAQLFPTVKEGVTRSNKTEKTYERKQKEVTDLINTKNKKKYKDIKNMLLQTLIKYKF